MSAQILSHCEYGGDGNHEFLVSTWTVSEKKKIAAEFLCSSCFTFYTREQIEASRSSSHISLVDLGEES